MTDYYCENCEFFRDKSTDKLIDGYCKKYNQSLNFYDWWEKCDNCVIETLKAENAALRSRLEKAVEFPYSISETVYYVCKISPHIYEICRGIIVELSIDKRGVIWTRAKYEDGSEYLHCSCNNFVNLYKTPEAAEERLKELKGEKQ